MEQWGTPRLILDVVTVRTCRAGLQRQPSASGHDESDVEEGRHKPDSALEAQTQAGSNASAAEPEALPSKRMMREEKRAASSIGQLCLMGVALLWGSYSPALR